MTNRPTSWPFWLRFGFVYKVSPLKSQHFFKFVNSHKMMTFHQAENRGRLSQVYSDIVRYWYSMIFPSSIGVWGFEVRPTLLGPAPPYLQVQCPRKTPPTGSAQARKTKPIGCMYGIFTDIWLIMGNVGKYTMDIHGSYGKWLVDHQQPWLNKKKMVHGLEKLRGPFFCFFWPPLETNLSHLMSFPTQPWSRGRVTTI